MLSVSKEKKKVFIVFLLGLWGCSSGPSKDSTILDTTQAVEEARFNLPSFKLFVMEGSNWNLTVDTLKAEEFIFAKKVPYVEHRMNSDSLIASVVKRFPDVLTNTDSCCIIHSVDRDIKLCKLRPIDDKGWEDYKADDLKGDYLIMQTLWYEGGSYLIFNLKTRDCFSTQNNPIFVSDGIVYAAGSYYGEGQFEIVNLKNDERFGLETGWDLVGHYSEENSIYLELRSGDDKKYLRVSY